MTCVRKEPLTQVSQLVTWLPFTSPLTISELVV